MSTVAILLMVAGGFVALANWLSLFQSYRTKRFHSTVPLIGAALLGIGMYILPATRFYCWSGLILDYGTLALVLAFPNLIREFWDTRWFNLVSEYVGHADKKAVCLRLFKRGFFTIQLRLVKSPNESGLVKTGMAGKWQREGQRVRLFRGKESASFDVIREASIESLRQTVVFASWESNNDMSLAGIEFVGKWGINGKCKGLFGQRTYNPPGE